MTRKNNKYNFTNSMYTHMKYNLYGIINIIELIELIHDIHESGYKNMQ